jgi:hypothetical protein
MRVSAKREDGRVFEQEEGVFNQSLLARSDDLLLDRQSFRIRDTTEMEKIDVHKRSLCEELEDAAKLESRAASSVCQILDVDRHALDA